MKNFRELREKLGMSQNEIASELGVHYRTIQNWENGGTIPAAKISFIEKFFDDRLHNNVVVDKKDQALTQLRKIKIKKRTSDQSEGRLINDTDLVPVEQYNIPILGQAGIKKAFFYPDEYVEENFDKEIIYVRPEDRAVYHKIEVDGNSMPGVLNPGEWAKCIEVPKNLWLEKGTFKPDKVYCLWHKDLGIRFKRISKVNGDMITLSSDNPDKEEYPDREFSLIEFSKILIVKMKEVRL